MNSHPDRLRSFFTIARFGPDTIVILSLVAVMAALLYMYGLELFAFASIATLALVFGVESFETIHLAKVEERKIVGSKCLVVKATSETQRGIVSLIDSEGKVEPEQWTAKSNETIEEGAFACVKAIKSIILEVSPADDCRHAQNLPK